MAGIRCIVACKPITQCTTIFVWTKANQSNYMQILNVRNEVYVQLHLRTTYTKINKYPNMFDSITRYSYIFSLRYRVSYRWNSLAEWRSIQLVNAIWSENFFVRCVFVANLIPMGIQICWQPAVAAANMV